MATIFKSLEPGKVGLVAVDKNGVLFQIGLSEMQSSVLNALVASMSSPEEPLIRLPKDYDLILKTECKNKL